MSVYTVLKHEGAKIIPHATDPTGKPVASNVVGPVLSTPIYSMSTTEVTITLPAAARKFRVVMVPATSGGDPAQALLLCANPPDATTRDLWLDKTLAGPRIQIPSPGDVEIKPTSPVMTVGVVALVNALGEFFIEVTA